MFAACLPAEIPISLLMSDVSTSEDSAATFCAASNSQAVTAIVHSVGVLADSTLANQRPAGIQTVFAPKITSAQLWRSSTAAQPGHAEILFSSVASLLGSPGQTNYSAANAMLDAMAAQWQARVRRNLLMVRFANTPCSSWCFATALLLHCYCIATALLLHCYCIATALLLHCYCIATGLLLHCYCIAHMMPPFYSGAGRQWCEHTVGCMGRGRHGLQ